MWKLKTCRAGLLPVTKSKGITGQLLLLQARTFPLLNLQKTKLKQEQCELGVWLFIYHISYHVSQPASATTMCVPWWYAALHFSDSLPSVSCHPGNDNHIQLLVVQLIILALLVNGAQRGTRFISAADSPPLLLLCRSIFIMKRVNLHENDFSHLHSKVATCS